MVDKSTTGLPGATLPDGALKGTEQVPITDTLGNSRKVDARVMAELGRYTPAQYYQATDPDYQLAIQRAIDDLYTRKTGTYSYGERMQPLYIPYHAAGPYLLHDQFDMPAGCEIYGDSTILGGGTVLKWTATSGHGFRVRGWDGASSHGTGCAFHNLTLWAYYGVPADRAAKHGIDANGQVDCENLFFHGWPGIAINAHADVATVNGNVSLSSFRNIYAELCDLTLKFSGGDAQACESTHIMGQSNRFGCLWDYSFLGDLHKNPYAENNIDANFPFRCSYSGKVYVVKFGQEAWCSANAPSGTTAHNTGWLYLEPGGPNWYTPAWTGGLTWYFGAPFVLGNPADPGSSVARVEGAYVEGGQNPVIMGGNCTFTATVNPVVCWSPDGVVQGGGNQLGAGAYYKFNNGLQVPGRTIISGDQHDIGPQTGAAADLEFNFHTTNFGTRINSTRWASGVPTAQGSLWFTGGSFYLDVPGSMNFRSPVGTLRAQITQTEFIPAPDNSMDLGTSGNRWKTVFATTGTINTSDGFEKEQVRKLTDPEFGKILDVIFAQELIAFKFKDSVAKKGKDARDHYGIDARQLAAAFEKAGLDPFVGGVLGRDPVMEEYEEEVEEDRPVTRKEPQEFTQIEVVDGKAILRSFSEEVEVPVTEFLPLHDEEGNPIMEQVREPQEPGEDGKIVIKVVEKPVMHEVHVMERVKVKVKKTRPKMEDGKQVWRYNYRPNEFWALRLAAMERKAKGKEK